MRAIATTVGDDVPALGGILSPQADGMYFAGRHDEAAALLFNELGHQSPIETGATVVVAGNNFGHGHGHYFWSAVGLLKHAGVQGIYANTLPYGFSRMLVNEGVQAVEWALRDEVGDGDELEIDLATGRFQNLTRGTERSFRPVAPIQLDIVGAGGIRPYAIQRARRNRDREAGGDRHVARGR